jgi:hypothetical protein
MDINKLHYFLEDNHNGRAKLQRYITKMSQDTLLKAKTYLRIYQRGQKRP